MTKYVEVTRAQRDAAKYLVAEDEAEGRDSKASRRAIAEATYRGDRLLAEVPGTRDDAADEVFTPAT